MTPPLLCLPHFHCELLTPNMRKALAALPEMPLHLWPGLPNMPASGYAALVSLPWNPSQAAACLQDLKNLSVDAHSVNSMSMLLSWQKQGINKPMGQEEMNFVEQWQKSHGASHSKEDLGNTLQGPQSAELQNSLLLAHSALLLAWLQEEQILELRVLSQKVSQGQSLLRQALGDSAAEGQSDATYTLSTLSTDEEALLPPWRSVLSSLVPFLPQDAVLVIIDESLAEQVLAHGQEPSLEEIAAKLFFSLPAQWQWRKVSLGALGLNVGENYGANLAPGTLGNYYCLVTRK